MTREPFDPDDIALAQKSVGEAEFLANASPVAIQAILDQAGLRNFTCAWCELNPQCARAQRLRESWPSERASALQSLETGCSLREGALDDLVERCLARDPRSPVTLAQLRQGIETCWRKPWAGMVPAARQQLVSSFLRTRLLIRKKRLHTAKIVSLMVASFPGARDKQEWIAVTERAFVGELAMDPLNIDFREGLQQVLEIAGLQTTRLYLQNYALLAELRDLSELDLIFKYIQQTLAALHSRAEFPHGLPSYSMDRGILSLA